MLRYDLIHPPLLEALATAGHGSRLLIADGNYPYLTARNASARIIHLNLRPGLLTVPEVLSSIQTAVNFEAAVVMRAEDGDEPEAHRDYRRLLGPGVPLARIDRFAFYEEVRSSDVGLVVATGDERLYANLLLTVGLR